MLRAVAGDIIGSAYEFTEQKRYDFELLPQGSQFTDDTVMTIAVAHWLAHYDEEGLTDKQLITTMQEFGRKYPFADMEVRSTHGFGMRIHCPTIVGATARQCV